MTPPTAMSSSRSLGPARSSVRAGSSRPNTGKSPHGRGVSAPRSRHRILIAHGHPVELPAQPRVGQLGADDRAARPASGCPTMSSRIDDDGLCFAMPSESLGPPHDEDSPSVFLNARVLASALKADGRAADRTVLQETGVPAAPCPEWCRSWKPPQRKGSGRGAVPQGVEGVKFSGRAPFDVRRAFEQHHDADGRAEAGGASAWSRRFVPAGSFSGDDAALAGGHVGIHPAGAQCRP